MSMFTQEELEEIAEAHMAVTDVISSGFYTYGYDNDNGAGDLRAAQESAARIVAAKIIADGKTKLGATCRACSL